jgi:hypothetical protein
MVQKKPAKVQKPQPEVQRAVTLELSRRLNEQETRIALALLDELPPGARLVGEVCTTDRSGNPLTVKQRKWKVRTKGGKLVVKHYYNVKRNVSGDAYHGALAAIIFYEVPG